VIGPGTDARVHGGRGQMFCLPEMIWVHWMRASRRKLGCESTGPAPDRAVVGTEHVVAAAGRTRWTSGEVVISRGTDGWTAGRRGPSASCCTS